MTEGTPSLQRPHRRHQASQSPVNVTSTDESKHLSLGCPCRRSHTLMPHSSSESCSNPHGRCLRRVPPNHSSFRQSLKSLSRHSSHAVRAPSRVLGLRDVLSYDLKMTWNLVVPGQDPVISASWVSPIVSPVLGNPEGSVSSTLTRAGLPRRLSLLLPQRLRKTQLKPHCFY